MRFGIPEMLIIFAVLLLFFGAARLPSLGSSLGSAIRNFKKGFSSDDNEAPDPSSDQQKAARLNSPAGENHSNLSSKASSKET